MSAASLLAILGMAAVTYACRAGGLWLARRFRPTPFVAAWMGQLPGAVFAALVAPMVLAAGPAGWLAATVGFLTMRLTARFLLALIAGQLAYVALLHVMTG